MNLSDLKSLGAVVALEYVEHKLKWKTPAGEDTDFTVSIRRPAYADVEFAQKCDSDSSCPFHAAIIARCVRFGKDEFLKPDEAAQLESGLFTVLMKAVYSGREVEPKKKPSRRVKNSGTS